MIVEDVCVTLSVDIDESIVRFGVVCVRVGFTRRGSTGVGGGVDML
jgi:hypothetical protein